MVEELLRLAAKAGWNEDLEVVIGSLCSSFADFILVKR
jgi:hypothetical protein